MSIEEINSDRDKFLENMSKNVDSELKKILPFNNLFNMAGLDLPSYLKKEKEKLNMDNTPTVES